MPKIKIQRKKLLITIVSIITLFVVVVFSITLQRQKSTDTRGKASYVDGNITTTYLRQALYSADGKTSWSRDCQSTSDVGPNLEYCNDWSGPGSITNIRNIFTTTGVEESYNEYGAITYKNNGKETLMQTVVSQNGLRSYTRTCPIDQNLGILFNSCTGWTTVDLTTLRGVGGEAYSGISYYIFNVNGQSKMRQAVYTLNGKSSFSRDCPVDLTGPLMNQCSNWSTANDLTNLRGTKTTTGVDEAYGAYSAKVYSINSNQYLRQVIITIDGKNGYLRTCPINSASGINFNACSLWTDIHLPYYRGVGAEVYGGFEEFTYTINNNTKGASSGNLKNNILINTSSRKPISKDLWGANFHPTNAGEMAKFTNSNYKDNPEFMTNLKNSGVKLLRFMGGCYGDGYYTTGKLNISVNDPTNSLGTSTSTTTTYNVMTIGDALEIADTVGADLIYQVQINSSELNSGVASCGVLNITKAPLTVQDAVNNAVAVVNNPLYRAKIKIIEIGNEQYAYNNWTPTEYFSVAYKFASALKSANTALKIGVIGTASTWIGGDRQIEWTNAVNLNKKKLCGLVNCFDFVTDHPYVVTGFDPKVIVSANNFLGKASFFPDSQMDTILQNRIDTYSPASLAITEWNLTCYPNILDTNQYRDQASGTVEQGFYTMEMLMLMAKKGISIGVNHTLQANSPCSMLTNWNTKEFATNSVNQVFRLTTPLAGGELVDTQVQGPKKVIPLDTSCTGMGCMNGGSEVGFVNSFSGYSQDKKSIYIYINNKHSTKSSDVSLHFIGGSITPVGPIQVVVDSANNFRDFAFAQNSSSLSQMPSTVTVPKSSIMRIKIPIAL